MSGLGYNGSILKSRKSLKSSNKNDCRFLAFIQGCNNPISTPPSLTNIPLIALNISAQINEKLTPSTFPQWCAQFEALLIAYNLLDYVIGDNPPPPLSDSSTTNP